MRRSSISGSRKLFVSSLRSWGQRDIPSHLARLNRSIRRKRKSTRRLQSKLEATCQRKELASTASSIGDSRTAPFAFLLPVDPFRPQTYPSPSPGGDFGPPSAPTALSIDQITQAIPDAPPEFILAQYQAKPTDASAVKLAWLVEKSKKPAEPAKVPEPTPLTFEQVRELMPLEDASVLLAVVESKPTSKEQALAVADVKRCGSAIDITLGGS